MPVTTRSQTRAKANAMYFDAQQNLIRLSEDISVPKTTCKDTRITNNNANKSKTTCVPTTVRVDATSVSINSASGYKQVMSVYIYSATGGQINGANRVSTPNDTSVPTHNTEPPKSRFSGFAKFMRCFKSSRTSTNIAAATSSQTLYHNNTFLSFSHSCSSALSSFAQSCGTTNFNSSFSVY
jgi:hypothetical protein